MADIKEDINQEKTQMDQATEIVKQDTDSYILKVLSGPHIGAEIPLNLGSYVVGNDDECDIILKDEFIAPQQFILNLEKKSISLSNVKENTSISGIYLEKDQATVNLFDIVGIGSTFFALGAPNYKWPNLEVPKTISYKKQAEEKLVSDSQEIIENDVEKSEYEDELHPRDIKVSQDGSDLKKRYASTLNFLSKQPKTTQIGIASGAIFAFAILLIIIFYFLASDLTSGLKYTPNQEIEVTKEVLKTLDLEKKIQVVGPVEGIIILKGYVPTQEDINKIKDGLAKKEIPNQLNLYSNEKILDSVKNVLSTKDLDLKVISLDNGIIELEGVLDSSSQLQNIVKTIQTDVPGVTNVKASVFVREQLYNSLEAILVNYNLNQLITLLINQTNITAQGSLTENQKKEWDKAKLEIENILPKEFNLTDSINVQKDEVSTDILKAQLWGVNLSGNPYLVFTDGKKYYVGDKIDQDLVIETIDKKGIYLIYKKNKLFYDYNDKVQWIVE